MAVKLTPARRRGLEVLAAHGGRARRSNFTGEPAAVEGYVYWQTVDWLLAQGFVEWARDVGTYDEYVQLTFAGAKLVFELGIVGPLTENDPAEPGRSPSGRSSVRGEADARP